MAGTGVTTFVGVATALRANNPDLFTEETLQALNNMDILLPYLYDVLAAKVADSSTYPNVTVLVFAGRMLNAIINSGV